MATGKTKRKLAKLIEKKLGIPVDPERLNVNRGASRYNDWCSWCGRIGFRNNIDICSWDTMTNIVKRGEIKIVTNDKSGIEIC